MGSIFQKSRRNYSGADADKASIPAGAKDVGDCYYGTDSLIDYTWDGAAWVSTGDFGHKLLHIQDQKAANTAGGTFTLGVWRTRDLNTVLTNEISGASLASNQITLPAGDYFIMAFAPGYFVSQHKTKFRNITDGSDVLIGTSEIAAAISVQTLSFIRGRFTLGAEKVLELHHRCAGTQATDGFGVPSNYAVIEVYSNVMIWKV